jgi:hypothetical protein
MKVGKRILLIVYIFLMIIATFWLFTFNEFSSSSFAGLTTTNVQKTMGGLKQGSLIFVKKSDNIKIGNKIIYYDTIRGKNLLNTTVVKDVLITNKTEKTYVIKNHLFLSDEYVIGKASDVKVIPYLGYLYGLLTSKVGYLIVVILPIIIYLVYLLKGYKGTYKHEKNKN